MSELRIAERLKKTVGIAIVGGIALVGCGSSTVRAENEKVQACPTTITPNAKGSIEPIDRNYVKRELIAQAQDDLQTLRRSAKDLGGSIDFIGGDVSTVDNTNKPEVELADHNKVIKLRFDAEVATDAFANPPTGPSGVKEIEFRSETPDGKFNIVPGALVCTDGPDMYTKFVTEAISDWANWVRY